jgi:hypothetical protein
MIIVPVIIATVNGGIIITPSDIIITMVRVFIITPCVIIIIIVRFIIFDGVSFMM